MANRWRDDLRKELRRRRLPAWYIDRLVGELEDHIDDLEEEDMRLLTDRLGAPDAIASSARESFDRWPFFRQHPTARKLATSAAVAAIAIAVLTALVPATSASADYLFTTQIGPIGKKPETSPKIALRPGQVGRIRSTVRNTEYDIAITAGDGSVKPVHTVRVTVTEIDGKGKRTVVAKPVIKLSNGEGSIRMGDSASHGIEVQVNAAEVVEKR